jgi:excisionase family DNA binding protein
MNVLELADYLNIAPTSVYKMIKRGKIQYTKIGSDYRFFKPQVLELINRNENK